MKHRYSPSRRVFLKMSATAGVGFAIGIQVSACGDGNRKLSDKTSTQTFRPNIWIEILKDNHVICFLPEAEMGQAVATSLPLIVAEELGADWDLIEVRHAPITPPYGEQSTSGSTSIRRNWQSFRMAGAMARHLLINAAKEYFNDPSGSFDTENSWVINKKSGKKIEFGSVVAIAQKLPLPNAADLRAPEAYRLIGHSPLPKFSIEKVTGELTYTSDIQLPGMVYATVVHPPVYGTRYLAHNSVDAKKMSEFIAAFPIKEGVAVIATNTWAAFEAAKLIQISWSESKHNRLSSEEIFSRMENAGKLPGKTLIEKRVPERNTEASSITTIKHVYTTPFQAHATMEPMCCVAHIHDGICEVWAPTQKPTAAKSLVRDIHYGVLKHTVSKVCSALYMNDDSNSDVTLHPQFLGGGFGRRLKNDYVSECVQIASKLSSPVKLQWTREEDIQHDYYRATSRHQMQASIDKKTSQIIMWSHKIISPSISKIDIPYNFKSLLVTAVKIDTPVPLGPWRSVNNSNNIYAVECFVDDIAHELSLDPVQLRISLLDNNPRLRHVLIEAERKAISTKENNHALGCAIFKGYGSYIALITEMGLKNNTPSIIRMTAVVDCGIVIDPDQAKAQIEGGLIFAVTAATCSEITIDKGRVKQDNFHNFPLLRISETPEINISIINNMNSPGGLGEVPVPPVAPSIHNAMRALTGC